MSNRNLSPTQFFHGTTADLEPGDHITPWNERGLAQGVHASKPDEVYAADTEDAAWGFALSGANRAAVYELQYGEEDLDAVHAQPKVYEVEPEGSVAEGDLSQHMPTGREYTMPRARVTRRIDIPSPTHFQNLSPDSRHSGPVQGRIPKVNWRYFEEPVFDDFRPKVEQPREESGYTQGRLV